MQSKIQNGEEGYFSRTELLLGKEVLEKISFTNVILFGVGGVGSWCAEALVRSGISNITIVDPDRVNITNINRQLPATINTLGKLKVEVLKERLLEINPVARINTIAQIYTEETAPQFHLQNYEYIIDAIDTLSHKAHLIIEATKTEATLFASMGAGLKMDPLRIDVAEFWKVKGCKLAAALRQKFRKGKEQPHKKFMCVYSEELLENRGHNGPLKETSDGIITHYKPHINGTMLHVTGSFGFILASMVLNDITSKCIALNKEEEK